MTRVTQPKLVVLNLYFNKLKKISNYSFERSGKLNYNQELGKTSVMKISLKLSKVKGSSATAYNWR